MSVARNNPTMASSPGWGIAGRGGAVAPSPDGLAQCDRRKGRRTSAAYGVSDDALRAARLSIARRSTADTCLPEAFSQDKSALPLSGGWTAAEG